MNNWWNNALIDSMWPHKTCWFARTFYLTFNVSRMFFTDTNRHILKVAGRLQESKSILDNNPAAGLARAVAKAWELYGSDRSVHLVDRHLHPKKENPHQLRGILIYRFLPMLQSTIWPLDGDKSHKTVRLQKRVKRFLYWFVKYLIVIINHFRGF